MSYSLYLCLVAVSLCHSLNFNTKSVIKLEIGRNCYIWLLWRSIFLSFHNILIRLPEISLEHSPWTNYFFTAPSYFDSYASIATVRSSKYLNQWLRTISHREGIITVIRSIAWAKHSPNIFFDFFLFIVIKWIGKTK